ncbi:hypothetical protein TNCV_2045051 [Trichonephila clavipes]|nr:hypothetical protein TNCV_2045051 [Trichonephila clavipes]
MLKVIHKHSVIPVSSRSNHSIAGRLFSSQGNTNSVLGSDSPFKGRTEHLRKDLLTSEIVILINFSSNFQEHPYGHQVTNNNANLAILSTFHQVSIESPLEYKERH